jgi:hypothetical protein
MALKNRRTQKNKTNRVKRGGKKVGKKTKKSLRNKKRQSRRRRMRGGGSGRTAASRVGRLAAIKDRAESSLAVAPRRIVKHGQDPYMKMRQDMKAKTNKIDIKDLKFDTFIDKHSDEYDNDDPLTRDMFNRLAMLRRQEQQQKLKTELSEPKNLNDYPYDIYNP